MRYILFFIFFIICKVALANPEHLINSTCRISHDNSYGTAFCYKQDKDNFYLLTAGHCVNNVKQVNIDLFHWGAKYTISGEVIFCISVELTSRDVGVVKLNKSDFKGYPDLQVLELATDFKPVKSICWTCGCPQGSWPSLTKCRVRGSFLNYIQIKPAVIPGRSGSAIMGPNCKKVIGMILMTTNEFASAVNSDTVYDILKEQGLEP